jgi:hypothetical protein
VPETDYGLFLVYRFREELRPGKASLNRSAAVLEKSALFTGLATPLTPNGTVVPPATYTALPSSATRASSR